MNKHIGTDYYSCYQLYETAWVLLSYTLNELPSFYEYLAEGLTLGRKSLIDVQG